MTTTLAALQQFQTTALAKAANGLDISDLGEIFTGLLQHLVDFASTLDNPGVDKKAWVLKQVELMFDQLAPAIPLPGWLSLFRGLIIPSLKTIVLAAASGAIEAIYSRFFK